MIAQGRGYKESAFVGVFTAWRLKLVASLGRVWNNDDGTVEILAQADSSATMAKFIQEIRKGPTPFQSQLLRCQTKQLSSLP